MSLILNIDTATSRGSVSLAFGGKLLQERVNGHSTDHAAWIHNAVKELFDAANHSYKLTDINTVAVVGGPGSYTGLRVGMSTAKGLCYALNVPMISISTLNIMAHATNKEILPSQLLCPMIDARRMEVFTALYDASLNELVQPCAMILDENSFSNWLNNYEIVFFGSGSNKWKELVKHDNAIFKEVFYTPADVAFIANKLFAAHHFSDLAYSEPDYLKDFYSYPKK